MRTDRGISLVGDLLGRDNATKQLYKASTNFAAIILLLTVFAEKPIARLKLACICIWHQENLKGNMTISKKRVLNRKSNAFQ